MPNPKDLHGFLGRTQKWLQRSLDEGDQQGAEYYERLMDRAGSLADSFASNQQQPSTAQAQDQGGLESQQPALAMSGYMPTQVDGAGSNDPFKSGFPQLGRVGMASEPGQGQGYSGAMFNPMGAPGGDEPPPSPAAGGQMTSSPTLEARQAPPQKLDVEQLNRGAQGLQIDLEQETTNPFGGQHMLPQSQQQQEQNPLGGRPMPSNPDELPEMLFSGAGAVAGQTAKAMKSVAGAINPLQVLEKKPSELYNPVLLAAGEAGRAASRGADAMIGAPLRGLRDDKAIKDWWKVEPKPAASQKAAGQAAPATQPAEEEFTGPLQERENSPLTKYETDMNFRKRIEQMSDHGLSAAKQAANTKEFDRKAEFERRVREEYGDKPSALMEIIGLLLGGARGMNAMGAKKAAYMQGRANIGREMRGETNRAQQNDMKVKLQAMRDKVDEKVAFAGLRSKAVNARMLPHLQMAKSISGQIQALERQIPAPEPNDPRILKLQQEMANAYEEAIRIEAEANAQILPGGVRKE